MINSLDDLLLALRAVGEPTRLRLLALCARAPLTVSELTAILRQSQPRISRHLKILGDAGVLSRVPEGNWAFYELARGVAERIVPLLPAGDPLLALDRSRLDAAMAERRRMASQYFERNAARWDQLRSLHVPEQDVEAALTRLLAAAKVTDLLDVGTGTGRMLEVCAPLSQHAVGVDMSRQMLAVARANLDRSGLRNCSLRQGDMYALPFSERSFDTVICHQVLHFADRPGDVVAELARILRPGGRVVLIDFAPHGVEQLRTEHEHRRLGFSGEEVREWFRRAGLELDHTVALPGDPLTVMIWVAVSPAAVRPHASVRPLDAEASLEGFP